MRISDWSSDVCSSDLVERQQAAVLQAVGDVAVDDAQREAFGDRGLADAGLADQHGVVLGPTGEDLDGAADFLVPADKARKSVVWGKRVPVSVTHDGRRINKKQS